MKIYLYFLKIRVKPRKVFLTCTGVEKAVFIVDSIYNCTIYET